MDIKKVYIPIKFMADDQRQQAKRPDILVFQTKELNKNISVAGPIDVSLFVSTTSSTADWVVKLIDVFPNNIKTQKKHKTTLTWEVIKYLSVVRYLEADLGIIL